VKRRSPKKHKSRTTFPRGGEKLENLGGKKHKSRGFFVQIGTKKWKISDKISGKSALKSGGKRSASPPPGE